MNEVKLAKLQLESSSSLQSAEVSRRQACLDAAVRERAESAAAEATTKRQLSAALDSAKVRLEKVEQETRVLRSTGTELRQSQEKIGELEKTLMRRDHELQELTKVSVWYRQLCVYACVRVVCVCVYACVCVRGYV